MIQTKRLLQLFQELVALDNPSGAEAAVLGKIREELNRLGIASEEDDTGAKIGGNAGNLYAFVDGTVALPPLLLSAHMDCVDPAVGKRAVVHPDGTITSSGDTVLGADDLSGVAVILEALTVLKENQLPHRPLELLFDVSEETYCTGIQQFDFSRLHSQEAYVLDLSGAVGRAAYQAPSILSFREVFHGRAAHAAFSPEAGIHAIQAAAKAVASIPCGRVEDTTVNIGTISGGTADNIVPETCTVTGEVRSFDDGSARRQLGRIEKTLRDAAESAGAGLDFSSEALCTAYAVSCDAPVAKRFQAACLAAGLTPEFVTTYGGSDNNHFAQQGIRGLVVASGMNDCHSRGEWSSVAELERAARLTLALILAKE